MHCACICLKIRHGCKRASTSTLADMCEETPHVTSEPSRQSKSETAQPKIVEACESKTMTKYVACQLRKEVACQWQIESNVGRLCLENAALR
jgi:hypothetical protein